MEARFAVLERKLEKQQHKLEKQQRVIEKLQHANTKQRILGKRRSGSVRALPHLAHAIALRQMLTPLRSSP